MMGISFGLSHGDVIANIDQYQPLLTLTLMRSSIARHDEDIGYLYNLEDPRRGPLHAIRDCVWTDGYLLELGICYYDDVERPGGKR